MVALRSSLCLAGGDKARLLWVPFGMAEAASPLTPWKMLSPPACLPVGGGKPVLRSWQRPSRAGGAGCAVLARCVTGEMPRAQPLIQHVAGTAAEAELGLKAAMGERCRRVPGDAAGLAVTSMKRFRQQQCPAECCAATGLVANARGALPLDPTQL